MPNDPSPGKPLRRPASGADNRPTVPQLPAIEAAHADKYEILGEIGRGGMGIVYRARQKGLGRTVALKVLGAGGLASPEEVERFRREAHAAAQLHHPGIVEVFDVGEMEGRPYLAMEFVDGLPLDMYLARAKPDLRARIGLLRRVAEAVEHAHAQGIVHRDLKPGNVLVDRAGGPHVADFGLAKEVREGSETLTRSGAVLGTPQYMSPEQAEGESRDIDARSDVFSLGVMLYENLTGRRPFEAEGVMSILMKVISQDPAPPRSINPRAHADLETICLKALEKDRERRYASAGAFADDLERFLSGEPIEAHPVGRVSRMFRKARRNPTIAALWVAAAAGVGLAAVMGIQVARKANEASLAQERQRREQRRHEAVEQVLYRLDSARALVYDGDAEPEDLKQRAREVIEQVDRLLPDDPDDARLHYYRGEAQRLLGEDDASEREFSRAVEIDPQLGLAQYELGCLALERVLDSRLTYGGEEGAIQFEEARKRWIPDMRSRFALAAAAGDLPRKEKALAGLWGLWLECKNDEVITACSRAIDRGGQVEDFLLIRGFLLMNSPSGLEDYNAAVQRAPNRVRFRLERGILRGNAGDHRGAIEDYTKALALGSRSMAGLYLNRGVARFRIQDFDGAFADCTKAIEAEPGLAVAYHARAAILAAKKDYVGAIADFTRAIELKPPFAIALRARAGAKAGLGRVDEALADYALAIEAMPGYAAARFDRAMLRWKQQDIRGAREDLDSGLELEPDNVRMLGERILVCKWQADRECIRRDTERLRKLSPGDPAVASAEAWLRREDNPADEVAAATAAIERNPKNASVWCERGIAWLMAGQPELALQDLNRAIELDAGMLVAHINRGVARIQSGDSRGSLADFSRALELCPRDGSIFVNRGAAYNRLGESEAALADFDRALELQEGDAQVHFGRGTALARLKRSADAMPEFDAAVAQGKDWEEPHASRARLRAESGNDRGALEDLDFVLTRKPGWTDSLLARAQVRSRLGDWKGALEDANKALALAPTDAGVFLQRALVLYGMGEWKRAEADCSEAAQRGPGLLDAWRCRGACRQRLGDWVGALGDFDRALELAAGDASSRLARATALSQLGRQPEAIAECDRALELDPKFAFAYGTRGQAHALLGQWREAIADLEKAMAAQPELRAKFGTALEEARKNAGR